MVGAIIAVKLRLIGVMTVIFVTGYMTLSLLSGFARPLMAEKLFGAVNVGFMLIFLNYLISWVIALVYVRVANNRLDPMVAGIVAGRNGEQAP